MSLCPDDLHTRRWCETHVKRKGYKCAAMHDPTGRRGIWYRVVGDVLEFHGGREDEYRGRIDRRSPDGDALFNIFETSRWMIDDNGTTHGADVAKECVLP